MLACAPESGSRTPTFSGPPCARARSSGALATSNPAAPAPAAKLRRGVGVDGDGRGLGGSPWMRLLAVAWRFSYHLRFNMQWGMTARCAKGRGMTRRQEWRIAVAVLPGRRRFRREAALPWRGPISAVDVHEEAPMEEAPVLVERRAGYRVITLNRPRQLNAFNEAMQQALKRALAEAEED